MAGVGIGLYDDKKALALNLEYKRIPMKNPISSQRLPNQGTEPLVTVRLFLGNKTEVPSAASLNRDSWLCRMSGWLFRRWSQA